MRVGASERAVEPSIVEQVIPAEAPSPAVDPSAPVPKMAMVCRFLLTILVVAVRRSQEVLLPS